VFTFAEVPLDSAIVTAWAVAGLAVASVVWLALKGGRAYLIGDAIAGLLGGLVGGCAGWVLGADGTAVLGSIATASLGAWALVVAARTAALRRRI